MKLPLQHLDARPARILVAMSGGVDSSVAAALLQEAGFELVGVTLHLWDARGESQVGRCCAPEDRDDARRSCDALGIPHYVIDEREAFRDQVVDPFVADNRAGLTPSPCVHCNQGVKLGRLLDIAHSLGASHVATGHYARLQRDPTGRVRLLRGVDRGKDQSYFLFGLPQAVLSRMIFPLGELTKEHAREHGRRLGVPNWHKPDSQELCFVPDGDVRGFVAREAGGTEGGAIVDPAGIELGRHAGIEGFTIGQRRGIGVSGPAPRYVLDVIPETRAVVVGPAEALLREGLEATEASWIAPRPQSAFEAQVRIRYRHTPADAWVEPTTDGFRVRFREPQRALAPGQAAVLYQDDEVLGGGFIRESV
ncbi:MAG: tRNA 2-thiouridine(34) synthase MnmA [Myxococcales bacterium]|jgi:tRNA-specific 2-thiouridylase